MRQYVDLHLHTCLSDGLSTPLELLEIVRSKNISAFSVTDHDSLDGFRAVRELVTEGDPELITGLELSVSHENGDVHLLAYLFDSNDATLNKAVVDFQITRNRRGRMMVDKLNSLGVEISFEDVETMANGGAIGRPHVAEALQRNGAISNYEVAFAKYIGKDGPAYVPKANFTPEEAIRLVHGAGGLVILAHPGIDNAHEHLELLVELGLDGIEIYHPSHKQSQTDRFREMARRFDLVVSGGSDFHGRDGRAGMVGSQKVPYSCLEQLKERSMKK